MRITTPIAVALTLAAGLLAQPAATLPPAAVPMWQLRSKHFAYGMPVPIDARHQVARPNGRVMPGISVLVKEGFAVGHYDKFKVPAWVCTRWTEGDYRRSEAEPYNARDFKEDDELPNYAVGGTNLDHATSGMQRGHMARQEDNKAWGSDNVDEGCEMSNIVPQSAAMNNGTWNELEEEHRRVVANPASGIKAIWIINGPIFKTDAPKTVGKGIAVPDACYKLIGWFDGNSRFIVRAYVMSQTDTRRGVRNYLTTVDAVEQATGLDFFADLPEDVENPLEAERAIEPWR